MTAIRTQRNNFKEPIDYTPPTKKDLLPGESIKEGDKRVRTAQNKIRLGEVDECLKIMQNLNQGLSFDNLLHDEILPDLKDRIDFDNVILMGHSFGGATSLTYLQSQGKQQEQQQEQDHAPPFKLGVILDPWMLIVPETVPIRVPFFIMNAQFFHWKENMDAIKKLMQVSNQCHGDDNDVNNNEEHDLFSVVLGTKHQEVSDVPSLLPFLAKNIGLSQGLSPKLLFSIYGILYFIPLIFF